MTPATDTDWLLTAYGGGSHPTSDIPASCPKVQTLPVCYKRAKQDDKPGYVVGRSSVWAQRRRCARATYLKRDGQPHRFYPVLLRMGFTCAPAVTSRAVVSYTAFPPLPESVSPAVYFCCTGLGVASTGRYPASCPVKPGLSSSAAFRRMQPRLSVLLDAFYDYTIVTRPRQR